MRLLLPVLCGLAFMPPVCATEIFVVGDWTGLTIAGWSLAGGAGADLVSSRESAPDQTLIAITDTSCSPGGWRVDARRSDVHWPSRLSLSVRRTGDGSGPGDIQGGRTYQELTPTDSALFSGTGDRLDIPLQYRLDGISIDLPPGSYATTVVYTVVDAL
ncbi:MAG: hypothetical protein J7M38_06825 [Armatimonadetes bacterium]|nr:hypothetical protein [Armatimonadota bacterium]